LESSEESKLRTDTSCRNKKRNLVSFLFYLVILLVSLVELSVRSEEEVATSVILKCFQMLIVISLVAFQRSNTEKIWFAWYLQGAYLTCFLLELLDIDVSYEVSLVSLFYLIVQMSQFTLLPFKHVSWTTLTAFGLYLLQYLVESQIKATNLFCLVLYLTILGISLYQKQQRHLFMIYSRERALKDLEQTENLLKKVMPEHVYYNLKRQNAYVDRLSNATLMFADIVGFTQWSSGKEPIQVVEMLSHLFDQFDQACNEFGVYKVHTIGDCYVVMGYSTGPRDPGQEAFNVFSFAHKLISIIEEVNKHNDTQLKMRIGIHTGEVTGGIAGSQIVRYDIYGKDVLIANKVESEGIPGNICVSESALEALGNIGQGTWELHSEVHSLKVYKLITP